MSFPPEGLHLLKLHGSIAWSITHPSQPKEYVVPPERFRPRPPQVDSGELPAVIYGRRGKLRGDGPFLDIRSEFSRRLQSASCLVSVGYSFADDHVNALIRRWLTSGADRWVLSLDPRPPKPGQANDQTFADELWGSLPTRYSGRKAGARPVFYPWETTAEAGLPNAVLPPEQLREMFRGWEASLAGADSWSVPGIHEHLPLS